MNFKKPLTAITAAVILTAASGCEIKDGSKKASVSYEWSNVAIGGGGYITGIVYNPTEEGLAYVRTDIGGAYRFDKTADKWVPITDFLGSEEWNLIGIESIATDPVEPNRVYAECGTYTSDNGAILSSDDYGKTWKKYDAEFPCGANQQGRGTGERLAVNPHNNKELYCGTRNAGLWKSSDYGETWSRLEAFPTRGDYSQQGNSVGIMWVEFDPNSDDVYAGAAVLNGECIYKSSDGGATWETLPANAAGMFPLRAEISPNGNMYLAYSDTAGPNVDPKNGAVYALNLAAQTFTDITPDVNDGHYGGYGAISLDASDPDTFVVTSLAFWHDNGDNIYRTTDGGKTWNALYTKEEKNYVMDTSDAQWLDWGRDEAKTGWWTAAAAINPFNPDEVTYGTGATVFSTVNMTELGSGNPVTIKFDAKGIEETAVYDMISPPTDGSSPQLYSIMGDLTGFSHLDVEKCPDDNHFMKNGNPDDLDVAWNNGNVAVYTSESGKALNYTTDGGETWEVIKVLPERAKGGKVAISCDGSTIMWRSSSISGKTYVTPDFGKSWYFADGLGYNTIFAADKVNPKTFYAASEGQLYVSTDGGYYFEPTGAVVTDSCTITTVDGHEGHVWITGGTAVMYSEDGGKTFTVLKNICADALGFGAPEKENGYPAIYVMGTDEVDGNKNPLGDGIYRSTDKGKTWQKINDDNHLFGNLTPAITGDSEIFGRVYFATNGRGIVMGDTTE